MSAKRPVLALPPSVLVEILLAAERIDSIVVGGQALNIWGEHFYSRAHEDLAGFAPFTSKDIDFFGNAAAARTLADRLKAHVQVPDPFHIGTPNSAIVKVVVDGQTYVVDFIDHVLGIDTGRMVSRAPILSLPLPTSTGSRDTEVRLLHPLDVLKTRIVGITILNRTDDTAKRQMGAAPIVAREYIRDLLEISDQDDGAKSVAQDLVRELIHLGSAPDQDPIFRDLRIDLLDAAADLADHPAWDPRFAQHQIREAIEREKRRRDRRLQETRRRRKRLGS